MKFNQLNGFAFDKESDAIGAIAGVDFINQTMTILADDDEMIVASMKNVVFLENIGYIGKQGVVNHDVLQTTDEKLYEIILLADGNVQLHLLNRKLERVEAGDIITKEDLHTLEHYVTLVGNKYELEPEQSVDFNIVVVRENTPENGITYYYACNNAEVEEVDLIKVVFVGHQLLEEEKYERITMSHEEYLDAVDAEMLKEVGQNELLNYVTGLAYGKKSSVAKTNVEVDDLDECEDFCDDEDSDNCDGDSLDDFCDECGNHEYDCECNDW